MNDGGFIYEKITITSNSSAYATRNDWCVFVHLKRCEAFLRATERESAHWTPIHTGETGEDSSNVSYADSNTVEVYKIKFSVSENCPAYVSYFRNPKTLSEYAIITAAGLSFNPVSSNAAYINPSRLNQMSRGANYYNLATSFAHSMVMKGAFASYDLKSSSVAKNEIPVTCQYGICRSVQRSSDTSGGYSMVYNYTAQIFDNKTYSFGYAVKGDTIISIYSYDGGYPFWSIIGDIFDENAIGGNPYGVICIPNQVDNADYVSNIAYQEWVDAKSPNLSVIDYKGDAYPNKTIHDHHASDITCRCIQSFICARPNVTVPARLAYGALCCAFNTYSDLEIPGIDEFGNMMKGYVRTDVLRVVSHRLCVNAGSIFQGGNFVSMSIGNSSSTGTLGILLGWDSSNGAL